MIGHSYLNNHPRSNSLFVEPSISYSQHLYQSETAQDTAKLANVLAKLREQMWKLEILLGSKKVSSREIHSGPCSAIDWEYTWEKMTAMHLEALWEHWTEILLEFEREPTKDLMMAIEMVIEREMCWDLWLDSEMEFLLDLLLLLLSLEQHFLLSEQVSAIHSPEE